MSAKKRDIAAIPFSLAELDHRRRQLGMSYPALAERSGVSVPTLKRILGRQTEAASFSNIRDVGHALGYEISLTPSSTSHDLLAEKAKAKAEEIVALVQGTSGLENQAVREEVLREMIEQTVHELMVGSKRKLWST